MPSAPQLDPCLDVLLRKDFFDPGKPADRVADWQRHMRRGGLALQIDRASLEPRVLEQHLTKAVPQRGFLFGCADPAELRFETRPIRFGPAQGRAHAAV